MHTATLSTKGRNGKQPKCRIDKTQYHYTQQHGWMSQT